jgi:hypothetical protein
MMQAAQMAVGAFMKQKEMEWGSTESKLDRESKEAIAAAQLQKANVAIIHGDKNVWAYDKTTGAKSILKGITPKGEATSQLGKWFEEQSKHKPGSKEYIGYQDAIDKATSPSPAKTAIHAFLEKNPNATPGEIAAYQQTLKGKGISVTLPDGTTIDVGGGQTKIPEKEAMTFRDMETAAKDLINISTSITSDVGRDPTLIGTTGWMQRTIDSVARQVEGIVKKLGPKAKANLNPDKYDWKTLSSGATTSAKIKSRVIKLAYLVARLREPDARQFSDADIQRAIDEIGGGTGSPEQMETVMRTIQLDAIRGLNRYSQRRTKQPYRPQGFSEETMALGRSLGLSEEEVILRHIQKYGMK